VILYNELENGGVLSVLPEVLNMFYFVNSEISLNYIWLLQNNLWLWGDIVCNVVVLWHKN